MAIYDYYDDQNQASRAGQRLIDEGQALSYAVWQLGDFVALVVEPADTVEAIKCAA